MDLKHIKQAVAGLKIGGNPEFELVCARWLGKQAHLLVTDVTLENCARYIQCRQGGREYVSPQRRIEELETALRNWWLPEFVESNPEVRGGSPVLKGTRFPLARVFAELRDHANLSEIEEEYDLPVGLLSRLMDRLATQAQ